MLKDDGGQAFPVPGVSKGPDDDVGWGPSDGMSVRLYVATAALTGLLGNVRCLGKPSDFAKWAYEQADAMIEEGKKTDD